MSITVTSQIIQLQHCQVARNFMDQPVDLHKPEPPRRGGVTGAAMMDFPALHLRGVEVH